MDDESGDDEKDELTSGWVGESDEMNLKLIPTTRWCIPNWAICDFKGDGWRARNSDNRWGAGTAMGLKRDEVVKIARLSGCKNFVRERQKIILDAFVDLHPVERFENGGDMCGFRSLNVGKNDSFWICWSRLTVWIWVFTCPLRFPIVISAGKRQCVAYCTQLLFWICSRCS